MGKVLDASGPADAYFSLVSYWDDAESIVLGAGRTVSMASRPDEWPALDGITEQMLWLDLVGYLPDDILTKLDRAAMAVSLETRVPFLDRAVFDLAWRLPTDVQAARGDHQVAAPPGPVPPRPGRARSSGRRWDSGFPSARCCGVRSGRGRRTCWTKDGSGARGCSTRLRFAEPGASHLAGRRDLAHELWDILALQAWLDRWLPAPGHSSRP